MFYTRGPSDDFNRLATVSGDEGWAWNNILPFILKVGQAQFRERTSTKTILFLERETCAVCRYA